MHCLCVDFRVIQGADASKTPPKNDFCIDDLPENHPVIKVKKLEDEGQSAFNVIMEYQASPHISRYW